MQWACLNLELICLHNQHRQAFSMRAHLSEVKQTAISASDSRVVAVVCEEERAAKVMEWIEMPVIERIKAFNENTSSNKIGWLFLFFCLFLSMPHCRSLDTISLHLIFEDFFFISVSYVGSSFAVIHKWNKIHWDVRLHGFSYLSHHVILGFDL